MDDQEQQDILNMGLISTKQQTWIQQTMELDNKTKKWLNAKWDYNDYSIDLEVHRHHH